MPLVRPTLGREEEEAVQRVLRSGRLVQGPEVEAFEAEFARQVGCEHAVAVSSGTAALMLSLCALDLRPGDEVIVPAYTFIATANAASLAGARVVPADVLEDSLNLDPSSVDAVQGEKTAALIPVHQFGLPADVGALGAAVPGVPIVEDAACAAGAETAGHAVGRPHGLAACFSFHPRKVITTGEGGMVTTSDRQLAAKVRALRQHGQTGQRLTDQVGYNLRMDELSAAIGRQQLRRLPDLVRRRQRAARLYAEHLQDLDWLRLPHRGDPPAHTYQSYVVRLGPEAPLARLELIARLQARGVEAQAGVMPVHLHPAFEGRARVPLPVSEGAGQSALFLPMHAELSEEDVMQVVRAIREAAAG